MDLTSFQNTIQGLVVKATGLAGGKVVWAKQTRSRPVRPFVELDDLDQTTTQFSDDSSSDNPDPQAPSHSQVRLFDFLPAYFDQNALIVTVATGLASNYEFGLTVLEDGPVPATIDFSPAEDDPTQMRLTIFGRTGVMTADDIDALLQTLPDDFIGYNIFGTTPIESSVFTGFGGGENPGDEILLTTKEHVEVSVQVRVFSSDVTGSNNAFNVANTIRKFFSRESTTDALGSIALVSRGVVVDATIVLQTEYEGRAVMTLLFRVADSDTETNTYIETATVQTTIAQTSGDVVQTATIPLEED